MLFSGSCSLVYLDGEVPCWVTAAFLTGNILLICTSFVLLGWMTETVCRKPSSEVVLQRMWRILSIFFGVVATTQALACCSLIAADVYDWAFAYGLNTGSYFVACAITLQEGLIHRVQSWLLSQGQATA